MDNENQRKDDRSGGTGRRAEDVLRQILADAHTRERSVFTEKTYADEPILTTGSDFKRMRQEQEKRRATADAADRKRPSRNRTHHGSATRPHAVAEVAPEPIPPRPQKTVHRAPRPQEQRPVHRHANRPIFEPVAPATERNGKPGPTVPTATSSKPIKPATTQTRLTFAADEPFAAETVPEEPLSASAAHTELPSVLRKLRALESVHRLGMTRQDEAQLFVRQAKLAAGFTDDAPYLGIVPYHRSATYYDLSDPELRGYFTWRTRWLTGDVSRIPNAYARIRAAEIVNGICTVPGIAGLAELQRLQARSNELDRTHRGPAIPERFAQWVRDYAIVHNLDARALVPEDERTFAHAVSVLQRAETATVETGYRPQPAHVQPASGDDTVPAQAAPDRNGAGVPAATGATHPPSAPSNLPDGRPVAQAPAKDEALVDPAAPTDVEVWHALVRIANYHVEKSPFLRTHEPQAAAVAAVVFERLVDYCALHSRVSFTEALVGRGSHRLFTPFLGLPFVPADLQPDMRVPLSDASCAVRKGGRWRIRQSYSNTMPNKRLHAMIHAMDRHMRIDWDAGRPLKARALPDYLDALIAEASAQVHQQEAAQAAAAEVEKRRITFDLSKLGGIRADAAVTRDALLVDEEIDDEPAVPEPFATTPERQPAAAPRAAGDGSATRTSTSERDPRTAPAAGSLRERGASGARASGDDSRDPGDSSDAAETAAARTDGAGSAPSPVAATRTAGAATDPALTGLPTASAPVEASPISPGVNGEKTGSANPCGLTDRELAVLQRILAGTAFDDLLGPGAPMESVLIDAINEKLFDEIGDAVIEYADDNAQLIPDYRDDVLEILGQQPSPGN